MMGEGKRLEQWNIIPPPWITMDVEGDDRWDKLSQGKFIRTIAETLPYSDELYNNLEKNKIFKKISKIDDEYVLYKKVWKQY